MSNLSTHVLDVSCGRPAADVDVTLERRGEDGRFTVVATGRTDSDGRVRALLPESMPLSAGEYRLAFATAHYFADRRVATFYPEVTVHFAIVDPEQHHHVPLLLSPFGYSTYRGS